jgi:hypothetical protein
MDGHFAHRDLALVAQLAGVFVRPLDAFDEHAGGLHPFTAAETRAIAAHPSFRAPVNRAVTGAMQLSEIVLGSEQLRRLPTDVRLRCAVLLVSQAMDLVRGAAIAVAAAVLHRRVLKLTLKADLERIRDVFGPEGFEIATREAPLLHAVLADLDTEPSAGVFDPSVTADEGRRKVLDSGLDVLCRFVSATEPGLSTLMTHRCLSDLDWQTRRYNAGPLGAAHAEHIVRLIRRRVPSWSAIIG